MKNHIICQCNEIKRQTILNAVQKKNATTVSNIQMLTQAGTGCGRCKPALKMILQRELLNQLYKPQQLVLPLFESEK